MRKRSVAAIVIGAVLALGVVACADEHEDAEPVPSESIHDGQRTGVIRMPDGFRNVVYTCHEGNLLYVTSRGCNACTPVGSDLVVIKDDPYCA